MDNGLPPTANNDEYVLEDIDLKQFEKLTLQESHTWEGQIKKLGMIENMVRERVSYRQQQVRLELLKTMRTDLTDKERLNREIEMRVPTPIIKRVMGLRNGGYTLIVTKMGKQEVSAKPLTILIPAHADAVKSEEHLRIFRRNPANPDQAMARWVYDMGAAVMNNIALAADVKVPDGMCVHFAFTMGEETHSDSAKAIADADHPHHWRQWEDVEIIVSSEIGHVDVPSEGDKAMRYIMGRRGREKWQLKAEVATSSQGHFANPHVRSATHALGEALYLLNDRFHHCKIVGIGKSPRKRSFADLGPEILEFTTEDAKANDERTTSSAESGSLFFNIQTVPGREGGQSLEEELNEDLDEIAQHCEWTKHGIQHSLSKNAIDGETSYPAYVMPPNHILGRITADILQKVSGVAPVLTYGRSVADENFYAHALLKRSGKTSFDGMFQGVITIPIIGDNAHEDGEWVSLSDMLRVRKAIKMLIEDPDGFRRVADFHLMMHPEADDEPDFNHLFHLDMDHM